MAPRFRIPGDLPVPPGEGPAAPPDPPLVVQLALSRATDLARSGAYEEAVVLLSGLRVGTRQAVPVFHLCALIRAQAGMYEDAAELWARVIQMEPGHEGARAGMREIQRRRARPLWLSALLSGPVALAVVAAALLLVLTRPPAPPAGEKLDLLLAEQKRLAAELERLRAGAVDGPAGAPDVDPGDLAVVLEAPDGHRLLRFKTPLFDVGGADLRPEAKDLLGRLAAKLAGKADVTVLGFAVEPVAEPLVQARRRAEAVAAALRAAPEGGALRIAVAERPGGEAPEDRGAVALRLARVTK